MDEQEMIVKRAFLLILSLALFAFPSFADQHEPQTGSVWYLTGGIGGAFSDVDSNVESEYSNVGGFDFDDGATWNAAIGAYPRRFMSDNAALGLEVMVERSLNDSGFDGYYDHFSHTHELGTLRTTVATVNGKLLVKRATFRGYTPFIRAGVGLGNAELGSNSDFGVAGRVGVGVQRMFSNNWGFTVAAEHVMTDASPTFGRGSSVYASPDYTGVSLNLLWKAN